MADLNLHISNGHLSNFADDTQLTIIEKNEEEAIKSTQCEAEKIIKFFESVKLCNNPDKAALIWNSKGKHKEMEMKVGGEVLKAAKSEKLLGIHISSDLNWTSHVEKLSSTLKQRIGQLKRIKHKRKKEKLKIVAEAIFNAKLRYAISVWSNPKYEFNHMEQSMDSNIAKLQVIQNDMLRVLEGHTRKKHINMEALRKRIKMFSVNQMSVYHVGMEMFNIINHSSSEFLQRKMKIEKSGYSLRRQEDGQVRVPEKFKKSCTGFSQNGPKLWNYLPSDIRTTDKKSVFKAKLKNWIWTSIPSV